MICILTEQMFTVPSFIASQCIKLCHEDSEMQQLFKRIATQRVAESDRDCILSYAWKETHKGLRVVGWVSLTYWEVGNERRPQVQMYVAMQYRSRSLAHAMCACMHEEVTKHSLVCVFSDYALNIARRLGWRANQYKAVDDGWIGVGSTDGEFIGTGADSAGLHATAPEVCNLPLACREERSHS